MTTAIIGSITLHTFRESSPDLSLLDQFEQAAPGTDEAGYYVKDQERKRAFFAGEWFMVGLRARAHLRFIHGERTHQLGPVVESAGVWGIESDSEPSHFLSTWDDDIGELHILLKALRFTDDEIRAAPVAIMSTTDNPQEIAYSDQFTMVDMVKGTT